jgi:DNA-binding ferritin-like protein (Dps family)
MTSPKSSPDERGLISKVIGPKRHYRQHKARMARLPESYRTAVAGVERYATYLGGLGDASSILSMLDDLADLFEQAAADGTPIREIVGDDPVEFAEAFVRNYPAGSWIVRERERLVSAVERAEEQEGEASHS